MECKHTKPTDAAVSVLDSYVRREFQALVFRVDRLVDDRHAAYVREPNSKTAIKLANMHSFRDSIKNLSGYCKDTASLSTMVPLLTDLIQHGETGACIKLMAKPIPDGPLPPSDRQAAALDFGRLVDFVSSHIHLAGPEQIRRLESLLSQRVWFRREFGH